MPNSTVLAVVISSPTQQQGVSAGSSVQLTGYITFSTGISPGTGHPLKGKQSSPSLPPQVPSATYLIDGEPAGNIVITSVGESVPGLPEVDQATFSQSIPLCGSNGSHTITVKATDGSGAAVTASVTVLISNSFQRISFDAKYWNFWSTPAFISANESAFTATALGWPDRYTSQIISDFGFSIFPLSAGKSCDGKKLDCILDPGSNGSAHTPTPFGEGVVLGADFILSSQDAGLFYWYLLTMHETVNQFTGAIASGWIWANGSPVLGGGIRSPFPNICDIVVSGEIGNSTLSQEQYNRMISSGPIGKVNPANLLIYIRPDAALFLYIQQQYGWAPYRKLFALVKGIPNFSWGMYPDVAGPGGNPERTAVTCALLAKYCGLASNDLSLLNLFNQVANDLSQTTITQAQYEAAQAQIPVLEAQSTA